MGRLEFTTPRDAWGGEADAFTPLLGTDEMLTYLGRETDIGSLTVVETEHATAGGRSLDILAKTDDGRLVAIENQYGRADHDHLTRGLAYAVAVGAAGLVIIAEEHRDEFVSVADYLNTAAAALDRDAITVWLVRVRAVRRSGDSIWSPELIVQAGPNEWEASIARARRGTLTTLDEFYAACEHTTDKPWADTAQTIVDHWLSRKGTRAEYRGGMLAALYCPTPSKPDGLNVIQLETGGRISICRGYVRDSSGTYPPDTEPEDLDAELRDRFPNSRWPKEQHYVSFADADADSVNKFADWLVERLSGGSTAGDTAPTSG